MSGQPETIAGTCVGYRVEARALIPTVLSDGKTIIGTEWSVVPFESAPIGVKPHHAYETGLFLFGVYNYAAAQALRWWLMSDMVRPIQTRIARYKIKYSAEKHDDGHCDEVDSLGRPVASEEGGER